MANGEVLFFEGFEFYGSTGSGENSLTRIWSGQGGGSLQLGRWGVGKSFQGGGGQSTYIYRPIGSFGTPGPKPRLSVGFGFKYSAGGFERNEPFFGLNGDKNWLYNLRCSREGRIAIYAAESRGLGGATLVAETVNQAVAENEWVYFEIEFYCNATAGFLRVYLNGNLILEVPAGDTSRTGNIGVAETWFGHLAAVSGGSTYAIDDIVVVEGSSRIGEHRVDPLVPMADVQAQWTRSTGTAGYPLISEKGADLDATYIEADTPGRSDTYELSDLVQLPKSVKALRTICYAKKTDAEPRGIRTFVTSGGATVKSDELMLGSTYNALDRIVPSNPQGGGWGPGSINAVRIGVEVST